MGDGANLKDQDIFGASGWFGSSRDSKENIGDINIRLINCRNKVEPTATPTLVPTATPEPAALGNQVFLDIDGDGRRDDNEPGVADVSVTLFRVSDDGSSKEAIGKAVTDEDGFYGFENLDASVNYELGFAEVPGFPFTQPNAVGENRDSDVDPSTGRTKSVIDLAPGETNNTIDAGIIPPATPTPTATPTDTPTPTNTPVPVDTSTDTPTPTNTPTDTPTPTPTATNIPASIGDRVWKDDNGNGIQDNGEPGVAGITVNLLPKTSDEPIASTVTNTDGSYEFTGLSPKESYRVEFVVPAELNLVFTTQKAGGAGQDSNADSAGITQFIELDPGERDDTIDAGVQNRPATIGDRAWLDENLNDQQDPGEPGIMGVTVELLIDANGDGEPETVVATTMTDADGFYSFTELNAKEVYYVRFTEPDGPNNFFPVKPGSDPTIDIDPSVDSDADPFTGIAGPISLSSGEENLDIDVGYVIPPNGPTLVPGPTNTPAPAATDTPVPAATDTPAPTPTPGAGSDGTSIMIGTNIVASGDEVVIMLDGFNLDGLGTATVDVIYDPTVLEAVACNKDPNDLFDLVQCNISFAPDTIRFNVTALTGVSGDVVVAEVTFRAIGSNGDESDIGLNASTFANSQGTIIPVELIPGRVVITDARSGDVTCDGSRDAIDAMFTLQHTVGMREGSETCTQPDHNKSILMDDYCDTNTDENCDAIDAMFTLQCAVGLTENGTCTEEDVVQAAQRIRTLRQGWSVPMALSQDKFPITMEAIPAGTIGKVTVPIILDDVENVGTATVNIVYDPDKLSVTACNVGGDLPVCNPSRGPDMVSIAFVKNTGASGDVELATIEFDVLSALDEPAEFEVLMELLTDPDGKDLLNPAPAAINENSSFALFLPLIQK